MKKFNLLDLTNTDTLVANASWVLPQVAAWFNNWNVIRNSNGKISFKRTLEAILADPDHPNLVEHNLTLQGVKTIWSWLTTSPRGNVFKTPSQTSADGIRWSAGVPLILSFYKQYRNVQYGDWDWSEPQYSWWLDKDLINWVETSTDSTFQTWFATVTPAQVEDWLNGSLTVRRGDSSGKARKPTTLPNIYSTGNATFDKLPRLVKLSICGAHCYHPSHGAKFLLYHPTSWDQPYHRPSLPALEPTPTNLSNPWNEI